MDPICPTDCSSNLAVVAFDNCNAQVLQSEINKLYIAKNSAAAFTDWTDPLAWAKRLSETDTVPVTTPSNTTPVGDLIRPLTIIGNRPIPALVTVDISNSRKKVIRKDFTLNVVIDEITPENLEFQRTTECGATVKFWYGIKGGKLFGGESGIVDALLTLDLVLAEGSDQIVKIQGTLQWSTMFTEEAIDNPIAA